jgi:hypothetical protein
MHNIKPQQKIPSVALGGFGQELIFLFVLVLICYNVNIMSIIREAIAITFILVLVLLLLNSPSVLADMFMLLFNFVWQIVQSIQILVVDIFERLISMQ